MNLILHNRHGFPLPFALRRAAGNGSLDRLFDSMMEDCLSPVADKAAGTSIAPRVDVTESDKAYTVEAELPGVLKENVKISVDGKKVVLEAEVKRKIEHKDGERKEGETAVFAERTVRKFARSFSFAIEVDDERTIAKLENGILTLTLPKKEALRPKQIQVQ
jgi:HSP20 family protein